MKIAEEKAVNERYRKALLEKAKGDIKLAEEKMMKWSEVKKNAKEFIKNSANMVIEETMTGGEVIILYPNEDERNYALGLTTLRFKIDRKMSETIDIVGLFAKKLKKNGLCWVCDRWRDCPIAVKGMRHCHRFKILNWFTSVPKELKEKWRVVK